MSDIYFNTMNSNNLFYKVEREKCFFLHGGKEIYNVAELLDEALTMGDDTFNHHVTHDKNDFANWIRDVYMNNTLAKKVTKAGTRAKMVIVLEEALSKKEKTLANKSTTKKKSTAKK